MLGRATAEIAVVSVERARGCGRKGTALACGAGLAAGRGRRGAASGPSVLAGPERSEGEAGRAQRGKRSELGPRGWAGALGWTETGPRSRVGLLDRARLVGLSAGVVWAGFGLSLGWVWVESLFFLFLF